MNPVLKFTGERHYRLKKQEYRCYYTGRELNLETTADRLDSLSIDRLDSSLPYQKGNVVLTTWRINRAKSDLSYDEFIAVCRLILNYAQRGTGH
jgi:hypothetical protein